MKWLQLAPYFPVLGKGLRKCNWNHIHGLASCRFKQIFISDAVAQIFRTNRLQHDVAVSECLRPHPAVAIAKHNLVEAHLLRNKCHLHNLLATVNYLLRVYFLKLSDRVRDGLVRLALILDSVDAFVYCSVDAKLDIVCLGLQHDRYDTAGSVDVNDRRELSTCLNLNCFHEANLQVKLAVRDDVEAPAHLWSVWARFRSRRLVALAIFRRCVVLKAFRALETLL